VILLERLWEELPDGGLRFAGRACAVLRYCPADGPLLIAWDDPENRHRPMSFTYR